MLFAETDIVQLIIANGITPVIVVVLILSDKLTTTGERDRLRSDNETLREEVKALNESIRADIVPPLVQINGLMKDVIKELSNRGKYYPPEQRGE